MIDFLLRKMQEAPQQEAIVSREFTSTYGQLYAGFQDFRTWLKENDIPRGAVVSFDGDYSPQAVSLFLALAGNSNIVIPLSRDSRSHFAEFREISFTEYDISLNDDTPRLTVTGRKATHPIYDELKKKGVSWSGSFFLRINRQKQGYCSGSGEADEEIQNFEKAIAYADISSA